MSDDNKNSHNDEKPSKPYKIGPGNPPPDHQWKPHLKADTSLDRFNDSNWADCGMSALWANFKES